MRRKGLVLVAGGIARWSTLSAAGRAVRDRTGGAGAASGAAGGLSQSLAEAHHLVRIEDCGYSDRRCPVWTK
jgi:hypothetical protein